MEELGVKIILWVSVSFFWKYIKNKLGLSFAKLSLASAKLHSSLSSDKLKLATNYQCSTLLTKLAKAL